jgi:aminoglycoside phosphotransferase (APT) family kinase protein
MTEADTGSDNRGPLAASAGGVGVDPTRPVREGEEIDAERLAAWLAIELPEELRPAFAGSLVIEQFPSGHSNLTYLVRGQAAGGSSAELVLRRPPFGNQVKSAHDMGREARVLEKLRGHYDKAPRVHARCDSDEVLGAPFYVMERMRGTILRRKAPVGVSLDEDVLARLGEAFVDALVELHEVDWRAAGFGEIARPEGYVERQVSGWAKRYEAARTDDVPDVERAAAWLASHLPESPPAVLLHNDFKYDNLVLDPAELSHIVGVLDWEMSTVGDPLMDLGTALAYWVEPSDAAPLQQFTFGPTNLPGSPSRRELAERYAERRGLSLEALRFYYCFALFKNAVVAQQIYARYQKGLTQDPRFGAMIFGVRLLGEAAVRTIDSGEI